MADVDRCVCCGAPIPEGVQVCYEHVTTERGDTVSLPRLWDVHGNYITNPSYKEIAKLAGMLRAEGIPHTYETMMDGWHICYPTNMRGKRICSVIEHCCSYGRETDRLEIMGLMTSEELQGDGVLGYLTAEEVFNRINAHWEKNKWTILKNPTSTT